MKTKEVNSGKEDLLKYIIYILLSIVLLFIFAIFEVIVINKNVGKSVNLINKIEKRMKVLEEKFDTIGSRVAGDAQQRQPEPEREEIVHSEVSVDDDPSIGKKDAPVVIVEFSEYQCPFCGRYYSTTYPFIKKDFIDTGKVRYVIRDWPLSFHQNAKKAAEAANCALEQGKYFELRDKMFKNQQVLDVESLKKYAGELGMNQSQFNSCLDSGKHGKEVDKDFGDGSKYRVQGVPGFFIGKNKGGSTFTGTLLSGAQPYENFKKLIEEKMK